MHRSNFQRACCSLLLGLSVFILAIMVGCGGGGNEPSSDAAQQAAINSSEFEAASQQPVPEEELLSASAASTSNARCPQADNVTRVAGSIGCLAIKVFGTPSPSGPNKLVVFLHGDLSAGGPADYMDAYAPAYASPGVIVVRMIRPGYADSNGNASAGIGSSRMDAFKAPNITSVAVALSNLKRHYKASKLIAVGHSDGAATAATILGRHPNIINSAVLLSCNCDLRAWKPDVTPSLSPMDWVRYVPLKTQVVSMTGSADALVPEVYASTYIKALVARGIQARHMSVVGATHGHSMILPNPVVQEQIRSLIQTPPSAEMVARLPANTKCPTADNNTLVYAGSECLVIRKFYGSPAPGLGARLVVFLHGEVFPAGAPADYMDSYAAAYASPGVVAVRMLRPSYGDSSGAKSTGDSATRLDHYTAQHIDAIANALAVLREQHKAAQLIVVGHSEGASVAATILGKYPRLIDSAMLLACPCDLRAWRPSWGNSLSPMDAIPGVASSAKVISMVGSADATTPATYSVPFVNALLAKGVFARQVTVPGATASASTLLTHEMVQHHIRDLIQDGTPGPSAEMVARLPTNTRCPGADPNTLVYAGNECLVVRKFGVPSSGGGDKLVVFIHGDVSSGGAADYMDTYAPSYASPGVLAIRLLRPGYFDSAGAVSTGSNGNRVDQYTPQNIEAVANALAVLRQQHQASKLVVVGHSGGASMTATILGKYPRLVDSAVLMACPCDLRPWRPQWIYSVSPMDWAAGVPITANVMGMIGTADVTVGAPFSQNYTGALSARGVSAPHITLAGATHFASTLLTRTDVQAWIRGMIQ